MGDKEIIDRQKRDPHKGYANQKMIHGPQRIDGPENKHGDNDQGTIYKKSIPFGMDEKIIM
jgi:hypothetical protein